MKKLLISALAAASIGLSSVALADHNRGRYDGYRHHDRHTVVIHERRYYGKHYGHRRDYGHKHWKRHYKGRHHGRHHGHHGYVVHHSYDDDFYKWMGGLYILNEILHH